MTQGRSQCGLLAAPRRAEYERLAPAPESSAPETCRVFNEPPRSPLRLIPPSEQYRKLSARQSSEPRPPLLRPLPDPRDDLAQGSAESFVTRSCFRRARPATPTTQKA